MTRKQAIRSMVGVLATFWGGMPEAYPQVTSFSAGGDSFFRLKWGEQKAHAPHPCVPPAVTDNLNSFVITTEDCIEKDGSVRRNGGFQSAEYIPGTASTEMNIGAFKSFTFTNGAESITITRDEMWEALKG